MKGEDGRRRKDDTREYFRPLFDRIDLLRILARLERRRIAVGEFIDGEIEGAALAMGVAVDGTRYAVIALGREQLVMQRLPADIKRAAVVRLADLLDRLGEDDARIIGLGMERVDRPFAIFRGVLLDELRIFGSHHLRR